MPEIETPPETPATYQPVPEILDDESNTENQADNSASLFAKITGAANGAFNRVKAKITRGRGRPKNCPACGLPETRCACGAAGGATLVAPAGNTLGDETLSQEVVTDVCRTAINAGLGVVESVELSQLQKKNGDTVWLAAQQAKIRPDDKVFATFGKLATVCLKKYGVGTEYCPEIGVGVIVLGIGTSHALLVKAIMDMKPEPAKGAAR